MENDLPQELIHEILLYLPVKSLLRFKCLSESFSAIINSQDFINSHMKWSSENRINRSLIYLSKCSNEFPFGKVHVFDIDRTFRREDQEFPLEIKPQQFLIFRLVTASCNGLVIFPVGHRELVVLNPSTREYKNLPPCPVEVLLEATSLNIGYDSSTDDYKILVMNKIEYASSRLYEVWIFGLKSGCWRRIQNFPYAKFGVIGGNNFYEFKSSNCFVDGALHFLCHGSERGTLGTYKIVAFDVAEENFNVVAGPAGEGKFLSQLQVIEGCLWLRSYHPEWGGVDIYVRKKDGVEFTWDLLCYIDKQYYNFMRSAQFLGYSKEEDNKILFQQNKNIYSYDLIKESFEKIEIMNIDYGISPIFCIQSLVRINYLERPKEKEGLFSCIGSLFELFFQLRHLVVNLNDD